MSHGTSANAAVNHVVRLDGTVRILRVLRSPLLGWEAPAETWLTHDVLDAMRVRGVRVIRLRRGLRRAEVPLAWLVPLRAAPRAEVPGRILHPHG